MSPSVLLLRRDPDEDHHLQPDSSTPELLLSTDDLRSCQLSSELHHGTVRIKADCRRLLEQSSYFGALLGGSFSESRREQVSVVWNLESFIGVLKCIYGCPLEISSKNLLPLLEGALYFGVEALLVRCENWCAEVTSSTERGLQHIQLDDLIRIWIFSSQHELDSLRELFLGYLARDFMHAASSRYFVDVPDTLLISCLEHLHLTVHSEMHLAEALLVWIDDKLRQLEHSGLSDYDFTDVLKHIRVSLLPLSFAAGKRRSRCFSDLADQCIQSVHRSRDPSVDVTDVFVDGDLSHLRLRLTEYSETVNLSGCPQMTSGILLLPMLPNSCSTDPVLRKSCRETLLKLERVDRDRRLNTFQFPPVLSFEAVQQVDISKSSGLHIPAALECFSKSFPSLRILKAAYLLNFKASSLLLLVEKFPLLDEVDLTHDLSPIILQPVSVISPNPAINPTPSNSVSDSGDGYLDISSLSYSRFSSSNITRLTLEGRTDVCDSHILYVAASCVSLCYLSLKGCTSVTDNGISNLISKSSNLHSLIVCDTSFGIKSVEALCTGVQEIAGKFPCPPAVKKHADFMTYKLQMLHMGGCKGVDRMSLSQLLSCIRFVESLCLRDTQLDNDVLSSFKGSSLDSLDVSNTMISASHLANVIRTNPNLRTLKARGCRNIMEAERNSEIRLVPLSCSWKETCFGISSSYKLEEISLGWGLSSLVVEALAPALTSLRSLTVGLGGSLGEDALLALPTFCPVLESLTLYFQVLSDGILSNIIASLRYLKVLDLCFCLGDISISSFKFSMPYLRKLKLQRVATWITNDDLLVLAQSCRSLTELCLVGCKLLNSDTQMIISREWPGLISLHLEDCGEVTEDGVSSIFNCVALEVLFLRHNGPGIQKSFILDAVSELPMLRQLSLDSCDAREGAFDIPTCEERHSITGIKISRCKSQVRSLDIEFVKPRRRAVHKDTLVFLRNGRNLTRRVVKERI